MFQATKQYFNPFHPTKTTYCKNHVPNHQAEYNYFTQVNHQKSSQVMKHHKSRWISMPSPPIDLWPTHHTPQPRHCAEACVPICPREPGTMRTSADFPGTFTWVLFPKDTKKTCCFFKIKS